jgi:hemolysin activation/secretion protein
MMCRRVLLSSGLILLCSSLLTPAIAQIPFEFATQQLQRERERERAQYEQLQENRPDVRLPRETPEPKQPYPANEKPCFPIRTIKLQGDNADLFSWALKSAENAIGLCLGSTGINRLIGHVQNSLISAGYVTTRVLAPPQDLSSGNLTLLLVVGKIHAIHFKNAGQSPSYWNALPAESGDILNLRDIEQGLENFKRVPTADADIQIVPGEQPGESDLVIQWQQAFPVRVSLSADDGGSAATGKYQAGATFSFDNLLGLHELFYVSLNHNVPGDAQPGLHGSQGNTIHYSVPFGYWLLTAQVNNYLYRQTVVGVNQDYIYRGTSRNAELKLDRLVYRDGKRKTTLSLRAYQRRSHNFIDDTEVEVQQRQMGGFALGLAHKEFIGAATLDGNLSYKLGTHAFGTKPAPEEAFSEGTSRPRIINAELAFATPLVSQWQYQAAWRAQWNRSPLIPQDRFSIGGRYTVRGFDGESSLLAERGWLIRNDLIWAIAGTSEQVYVGVDTGTVAGPSSPRLLGTRLSGAALGWRGQFKRLQYEFFVGTPLSKPEGFRTASVSTGFNLNFAF